MSKIYPYTGFWKRCGAFVIDSFVISIPLMLLYGIWFVVSLKPVIAMMATTPQAATPSPEVISAMIRLYGGMFSFQLASLVAFWLYYSFMESSRYQATLGKMLLGIKVVDAQGQRITFWHATGRTLSKWISALVLYIGFLMAGANKHKQALHDIIASTYVVDKNYQPGEAFPEVQTHYVLLGLSIAGLLCVFLLPFLMVFLLALTQAVNENTQLNTPSVKQTIQDNLALSKLPSLQRLPKEQRQPFTENDYAFTFEDNGTVRAQRTDEANYALIMRPDENWPCCQPLVPDGCTEVVDAPVCQAR